MTISEQCAAGKETEGKEGLATKKAEATYSANRLILAQDADNGGTSRRLHQELTRHRQSSKRSGTCQGRLFAPTS
jgi:hypothetical protein